MVHIKIILGSVRPNRFGVQPAQWIHDLSKAYADKAAFELIDLKEVDLPFMDEPLPPSTVQEYSGKHTEAWANLIGPADGYVFITSEYNHSVPASLKNAIDFFIQRVELQAGSPCGVWSRCWWRPCNRASSQYSFMG